MRVLVLAKAPEGLVCPAWASSVAEMAERPCLTVNSTNLLKKEKKK